MSLPARLPVSFEDNVALEIDNPLIYQSRSELEESALAFAKRVNPHSPDERLWILAARIAQDPLLARDRRGQQSLNGLTEQEKNALIKEKQLGFWGQPKAVRVTIVTLCVSAVIQGWSQTGPNGSYPGWAGEFNLRNGDGNWTNGSQSIWAFAGVNAIAYLTASLFGCWISDPLQSLILGRRGAIFFSACLCFAAAIGAGCARSWQQLLGCRAVLGAGMGAKAAVTPIFGAEISADHLRGTMVMNWQLFDAFGIFLGFTANLIAGDHWRFQMASAAIPCLILLSLIWIVPESPRWLLKKNRLSDAFSSFVALRQTPLQAAAEMFYANAQIQAEVRLLPPRQRDDEADAVYNQKGLKISQPLRGPVESHRQEPPLNPISSEDENPKIEEGEEEEEDACLSLKGRLRRFWHALIMQNNDAELEEFQRCAKSSYYFSRIWQLFRIKRIRRATIGALIVMISQQLCGINVLQFYSSTFIGDLTVQRGNPVRNSIRGLWLSWGIGLSNFIFTFPVYYLIDKCGRRFMLLSSYPGMAISMLAACLSFKLEDDENRAAVVIFWMFCFVFFYSWGQGPVPFAYSSEVFPLLNREAGMSFAVFVNLFGAGVLALVLPQLTQALTYSEKDGNNNPIYRDGQSRLLGIFTGLCVLAFCLIFLFVPETAGATLGDKEGSLNYISLEELNYIFGVPTLKHTRYQITQMIPYACRHLKWSIQYHVMRKDVLVDKPEAPTEVYQWITLEKIRQEQQAAQAAENEEHAEKEESNNASGDGKDVR